MNVETYNGRELYRPSLDEKIAAIATLLASPLNQETRQVLRFMALDVRQEKA